MNFGERLKKARKNAGLSQAQLAEMLNVSQTAIYQYETGKRDANLETMLKIANVLGMDTSEIYESAGIITPSQFSDAESESDFIFDNIVPLLCRLGYTNVIFTGNTKGNILSFTKDGISSSLPVKNIINLYDFVDEIISVSRESIFGHLLDKEIEKQKDSSAADHEKEGV